MDVTNLIALLREYGGPESVSSRVEGEQAARALLDAKAGEFDQADAAELAHVVQRSAWQGNITWSRFRPAFAGGAWSGLLADFGRFNEFTSRMWRGTEAEALDALDAVFRDRRVLQHAGPSYPSLLMYLRDPEKYLVAISRLTTGLERITGISYPLTSAERYVAYCSSAHHLRLRYQLAPQEVDLLLWGATEPMFQSAYESGTPVLPVTDMVAPQSDAPSDLSKLHDWIAENEARAGRLPLDYLASRAMVAVGKPVVRHGQGKYYVRNPYVAAYAKRLAGGICDLCRAPAPFEAIGGPYLEAHHVEWLAHGGADVVDNVVALCPNCHRRVHVLDMSEDRASLHDCIRNRSSADS